MNKYVKQDFMRLILLITLSIFVFPSSSLAIGKGIKIIADDWPPFSFKENDSITGFSVEIIEQLISDTGIEQDGEIVIWPWARAFKTIQNTDNIFITAMHRNEERENLFHWVGPISPREIWLFKLSGRKDIVLHSLEGAKRYQTGVARKTSSENYLIKKGFIEDKHLQITTTEHQNIKKLLLGRIDLVTFSVAEMAWHLKQLTPPVTMQMVTPAFMMSERSQYFIAISKQVAESKVIRLQQALEQMKQDGRFKKIWNKYME